MLRHPKTIPAVLLLVTGLASLQSCTPERNSMASSNPISAPLVAVTRATRASLSRTLELAAEFRPYQEVDLHAKIAGYVKEIRVDVGDRVIRGELLATLEIPELIEDLQQASAAKSRSMEEVTRAAGEVQRSESAHNVVHLSYTRLAAVIQSRPGLVAQQEGDEALARDRVAEAQIDAAKAALAGAHDQVDVAKATEEKTRTLLAYSRITAPFAGMITKRYADTGAMIQAGTASQSQAMPVVRLSQIDRLRLVLPVPESVVPKVCIGAPIDVRVPALNRTFRGLISRYSGKVEAATRTMETEVDVPNPKLELVPGMYAYATITVDRSDRAIAVPPEAVSGQGREASVTIVDSDHTARQRKVTLGLETPSGVEVVSGLREDDLVIVGNRSLLKPGQAVTPHIVQPYDPKGER